MGANASYTLGDTTAGLRADTAAAKAWRAAAISLLSVAVLDMMRMRERALVRCSLKSLLSWRWLKFLNGCSSLRTLEYIHKKIVLVAALL